MKLKTNLVQIQSSNSQRPPLAEFDPARKEWLVKTDYPLSNNLAGSYLIFCADGSVRQITMDVLGNIIREVEVKPGEEN